MKPRVLMVIPQFRPVASGAEHQAERLSQKLVEMGATVCVLTTLPSENILRHEISGGVEIHRADFAISYTLDDDYVPLFKYLVQHRNTYDVLHCHMLWGHAAVATVVAKWFGKKVITRVSCTSPMGELYTFSRFKRAKWGFAAIRRADALVALSRDMEAELLEWGFYPEKVRYLPNGVDTDYFRPKGSFPPRKPVRFLLLGRRQHQKGIDTTLLAMKILFEKGLSARFVVDFYGWDYPEVSYQKMARELGMDQRAHFLPYTNDVLYAYQSSHCLLLPSRAEGLSNVLLEAMACGLPVICTPVSGSADVVWDNINGLMVPPEDPQALARAMEQIITNRRLCENLGQKARQRVQESFSLADISKKYFDLYEELLKK